MSNIYVKKNIEPLNLNSGAHLLFESLRNKF